MENQNKKAEQTAKKVSLDFARQPNETDAQYAARVSTKLPNETEEVFQARLLAQKHETH